MAPADDRRDNRDRRSLSAELRRRREQALQQGFRHDPDGERKGGERIDGYDRASGAGTGGAG